MQAYRITQPVALAPAPSKKAEVLQALEELERALEEFQKVVPVVSVEEQHGQLFEQMRVCLGMMIGGSVEVRQTIEAALVDR